MSIENVTFVLLCVVRVSLFKRLQMLLRNIFISSCSQLINLNIFPRRVFPTNIDQITFKRLGQWSTRLYITCLITSLVLIMFHVIIWPQTLTKSFNEPSLDTYNDLIDNHADTLECPCTFISSTYNKFIKIEPVFHQVRQ
jgi:hypothetical protein